MGRLLRAAGVALLLTTPAHARPAPIYCGVTVVPDYVLIVAYLAVLSVDPDCPPNGIARVRKASTLNRWANYRPIKPDGGPQYGGLWGWTISGHGDNIPSPELWTSLSWVWQFWDGAAWVRAEYP